MSTTDSPSSNTEEAIRAAEEAWMDAWRRHDIQACERVLADEFVLVSALGGEQFDKAKWLELARADFHCDAFHFDEVRVRRYGDVALAHTLYRQRATARGRDWTGAFRMTDVWVHRDGRWQVVSRHRTQLSLGG
jgi:ketosteroid isomerase-like protein